MRLFLFLMCLVQVSWVHAFEINVSEGEIHRYQNGYLIGDLVIGDTAAVEAYHFCAQNNKLYLVKNYPGAEQSSWVPNILITVDPANKVSVIIRPPKGESEFTEENLKYPRNVIPSTAPCETQENYFTEKVELFEVKSFALYTNMRDYLDHIKALGFKKQ